MSDEVVNALEICYLNMERLGAGVTGEWLHHNALESVNVALQATQAMFLMQLMCIFPECVVIFLVHGKWEAYRSCYEATPNSPPYHQGGYHETVSHSFAGSDELAIRFPTSPCPTLNALGYSCRLISI